MARCHWSTKTATVRERFSLSVIFVATAYLAGLLSLLKWLGVSWFITAFCLGLLLCVGATQVLLRKWEQPRLASILGGIAYFLVWLLLLVAAEPPRSPNLFFGYLAAWLLNGTVLGYLAGAIDSSVFLLHDFARDSLRAKRTEREKLRAAMGVVPPESPWDE